MQNSLHKQLAVNLLKSFEILEVAYQLKYNHYKSLHQLQTDIEIVKMLSQEIIKRKETAWNSPIN